MKVTLAGHTWLPIQDAKTPETRERRIVRAVTGLAG